MTSGFPTLSIAATGITAEGSFAQTQAEYLSPDPDAITELDALLLQTQAGIVAHYYMDPELQGVLSRCKHPFIHISDSLLMADKAVEMAENGAKSIVVLGVDFMSENARAMLDRAGFSQVPLYRVAEKAIGCSLADAAESRQYLAYLEQARATPKALHVVYINTSLLTKARAHSMVPTITVTSSNVLQTVLSAFAEIQDAQVFFGPDTYMGRNLEVTLQHLAKLDDAAVRAIHPKHTQASLVSALARFHYFKQGNCIVHHMFGADVVRKVQADHQDAFITAHLEVPGEMFDLALRAQALGRGRVGSTSDILKFITSAVEKAKASADPCVQVVLGTEAGMITSIVRAVEKIVVGSQTRCDIIFPVASEAMFATGDHTLPVVPGVAGGEGCSTAGGCATCPYMKMNSLSALMDVLDLVGEGDPALVANYKPKAYSEIIGGKSVAELGSESIVHMRDFSKEGRVSERLRQSVLERV